MLASARFQLQTANVNLQNDPILASVNEILEESIAKSRRLSHELSPPVLYHGSLYSALEWLGRQMNEQFGLTIELKDEKSPNLENTHLKVFLFRAVQELLFNIVKHADVKSARVTLSGSNGNIAIT
jgi:signal transduction histidine kinase